MKLIFSIIIAIICIIYIVLWMIITTIFCVFGEKAFNYCFHANWNLIDVCYESFHKTNDKLPK